MEFYTYLYLEGQRHMQGYVHSVVIFAVLIGLLITVVLYLRHRLDTRYRDLMIIFMLLIVLLLGIQYNRYEQEQVYSRDTSRMVTFLESVMQAKQAASHQLKVNSPTLLNGMILGIDEQFYRVDFNQNFSAYSLTPVSLVNSDIHLIDKE